MQYHHNIIAPLIAFYFIPLPITKTIYLHIPDGRAASPFSPPFSPTVTGWLLCESMSNGDCLMQYHCIVSVIQRRRDMWMMIPQLLLQLQTPEQNGGAAPMDALMPVSTEWLQWWPGGRLVRHKDEPAVGLVIVDEREKKCLWDVGRVSCDER